MLDGEDGEDFTAQPVTTAASRLVEHLETWSIAYLGAALLATIVAFALVLR